MHELSFATWFIHLATLFEWSAAIVIISRIGLLSKNKAYIFLGLSMLPNLASAMAAITWHIFDNSPQISFLVTIQAFLTTIGNTSMAFAAWNLFRSNRASV